MEWGCSNLRIFSFMFAESYSGRMISRLAVGFFKNAHAKNSAADAITS
jgi:hypothetical protein